MTILFKQYLQMVRLDASLLLHYSNNNVKFKLNLLFAGNPRPRWLPASASSVRHQPDLQCECALDKSDILLRHSSIWREGESWSHQQYGDCLYSRTYNHHHHVINYSWLQHTRPLHHHQVPQEQKLQQRNFWRRGEVLAEHQWESGLAGEVQQWGVHGSGDRVRGRHHDRRPPHDCHPHQQEKATSHSLRQHHHLSHISGELHLMIEMSLPNPALLKL